jgi:hypothetical protein
MKAEYKRLLELQELIRRLKADPELYDNKRLQKLLIKACDRAAKLKRKRTSEDESRS